VTFSKQYFGGGAQSSKYGIPLLEAVVKIENEAEFESDAFDFCIFCS
jgi:hypothetical protein